MNTIDIRDDIPQTYITVKYKGKDRTMRRFGEVTIGNKQIRPAEYLYEYRDGKKLSYSKEPSRPTKK